MAHVLKLDTFDFSVYVRLQPDEKFDPGQNPIEPRFAEAAAGEGQPLIAFDEPNKVLSWPVHLTPFKSASYADTEDGLNDLVVDVNGACRIAKRVEWRMDGATNSTFWDVQAAVFKPDFSYFKTRQFWLSGILTVYAKTYGDTGTLRAPPGGGTAAGTGIAVAANLGALEGDVPAQIRAIITTGSQVIDSGRIVGVSVIPSSYTWDVPLASILVAGATFYGASGAVGSQMLAATRDTGTGWQSAGSTAATEDDFYEWGRVHLSPASAYLGRNRVIALAMNDQISGAEVRLSDARNFERGLAGNQFPSGIGMPMPMDLGAFSVPSNFAGPTVSLSLLRRTITYPNSVVEPPLTMIQWVANHSRGFLLSRLLVLPEANTSLVIDADRTPLGGIGAGYTTALAPTTGILYGSAMTQRFDTLGNTVLTGLSIFPSSLVEGRVVGNFKMIAPVATGGVGANGVNATAGNLRVRVLYGGMLVPSQAVYAGKVLPFPLSTGSSLIGARALLNAGGTTGTLQVGVFASAAIFEVIASKAIATMAEDCGVLECQFNGDTITARHYTDLGFSNVTRLVGFASHIRGFKPGNPIWGLFNSTPTVAAPIQALGIVGVDYSVSPSQPVAPRDQYVFDSAERGQAFLQTTASAFTRGRDSVRRGSIPGTLPTVAAQVIGFVLPMDNDGSNDLIALEVKVRERFQYAR